MCVLICCAESTSHCYKSQGTVYLTSVTQQAYLSVHNKAKNDTFSSHFCELARIRRQE